MQFHLPGLLLTCKQTSHEATALVYAQTTIDTLPGDAWYLLYSKHSHSLCAYITSLRISEVFLDLMEQEVDKRETNSQATKACTLHLPRLERVCVMFRNWPFGHYQGDSTKEALRKWFGDDGLDVVVEERLGEKYFPSKELLVRHWTFMERG